MRHSKSFRALALALCLSLSLYGPGGGFASLAYGDEPPAQTFVDATDDHGAQDPAQDPAGDGAPGDDLTPPTDPTDDPTDHTPAPPATDPDTPADDPAPQASSTPDTPSADDPQPDTPDSVPTTDGPQADAPEDTPSAIAISDPTVTIKKSDNTGDETRIENHTDLTWEHNTSWQLKVSADYTGVTDGKVKITIAPGLKIDGYYKETGNSLVR